MRHGFVLLELLISMLIGGFISTGILTTIFQMNQVQQTVNTISSVYARVAIMQNQMERDIMGAFIPAQVDFLQTSTVKATVQKPIEKIFYGTSKSEGGRLDLLTFITCNPLATFYGVKNSPLKSRVARVVYRLIPDGKHNNSYILTRQEGTTNLFFESYTQETQGEFRPYPFIEGVQNLSIQYVTAHMQKDKTKEQRTYKRSWQWLSERKKEDDNQKTVLQKQKQVQLPNWVEITLALWDPSFKNIRTFHLIIPIMYKKSDVVLLPDKKHKNSVAQSKDEKMEA